MKRYDPAFQALAMALSALAGFVDATGFVLTGGFFVSFMSGNSTRLAVSGVAAAPVALLAGGLIASFLGGVVGGALLAGARPARRKTRVLALATTLLGGAATAATLGSGLGAALLLAVAMGSLNNVFLANGEVSVGVTYMTGTLVRAGQRIASAIRGEEPRDWPPYLGLWASLVAGAALGALVTTMAGAASVWLAAGSALVLTGLAARLERGRAATAA